jgi:NTE family protein
MNDERVVAVLSGGGAKAAAHVGAIKALTDRDKKPAHYVATSMGAVVAACFASGLDYRDVLKRITSISRRDVAVFSPGAVLGPFASNLLEPGPLKRTIARLVPVERFDELEVPLTVTAVDVDSGDLVLFGAGGDAELSLPDALYASCALPLYYPPAVLRGRQYVDGGLRCVLPLDVAGGFEPGLLFAVDVGPSLQADAGQSAIRLPAMLRYHGAAMRILMAVQTEEIVARWQASEVPLVLVRPVCGREATFALDNVVRFVEDGYGAAHRALDEWLRALHAPSA